MRRFLSKALCNCCKPNNVNKTTSKYKVDSIQNVNLHSNLPFIKKIQIGKGAYGKVYSGIYHGKKHNSLCAIKILNENCFYENEYIVSSIAKNLNSKYLCNLWNISKHNNTYYLVYPKYIKGDLFEYFNSRIITYYDIKHYIKQILYCVKELNDIGYAHLDIKLENFLLTEDNDLVLTDFGCARPLYDNNQLYSTENKIGTYSYIAPEVNLNYYGKNTDTWSIGVCLYILLNRENLYESVVEFIEDNINSKGEFELGEMNMTDPDNLEYLIRSMIVLDPKKRISIQEAIRFIERSEI